MQVLSFQIGIFIIIFLVGAFGTKARIYVCLGIGIFTLFAVFTTWLAILQFITIYFSYSISQSLADPNSEDGSYNFAGCFKSIVFLVLFGIIISFLSNKCDSDVDSNESSDKTKIDSLNNSFNNNNDNEINNSKYYINYDTIDNSNNDYDTFKKPESEVIIDTMKNNYRYNDESEDVFGKD